jgi:secondary thiamine-phosphate synthase enzyme
VLAAGTGREDANPCCSICLICRESDGRGSATLGGFAGSRHRLAGPGVGDNDPVWIQRQIELRPRPRGFHLVTSEIVDGMPELASLSVGIATVFMQHTSASLTLNENASPDVRRDFAAWFDRAVPDGADYFSHTLEGPDDMPAHIKASLTGSSLIIPVSNGRLMLGTWQGIYLAEHRDRGGPRRVVFTALGEEAQYVSRP